MGLDELKREILAQAQSDADRVVKQAREEADAILAAARAEAEAKRQAAEDETRRVMEMLEKRELAATALESKKLLMSAKKQVLDEVFERAKQSLAKLGAAERKAIVQSLVKRASEEIAIETVYASARDKELLSGYKTADAPIMGGIIAESKDGTVRADYSFETLLGELRDRSLEELGRIVFKD